MEEDIYAAIQDPDELRRELLETSKEAILSLQRFERFKLNKLKRMDSYEMLKSNIREINDLIARLKKELPTTKMRIKQIESPKQKVPLRIPKKATEIEDLEKQLSEVEAKLSALR